MTPRRLLLTLAACAAVVAGCGGSDNGGGGSRLSAADYRTKAEKICTESEQKTKDLKQPTKPEEVLQERPGVARVADRRAADRARNDDAQCHRGAPYAPRAFCHRTGRMPTILV